MKILKLHHVAYRCASAEATRHFYEDVLGLPLVHVIRSDTVPSTGEKNPYVHIFFRMADGSCIAFFDLGDGRVLEPSSNTPLWVNHLALEIGSEAELMQWKSRLEKHGIDVLGPTDHGFVKSIYFFDPNGVRLELTTRTISDDDMEKLGRQAHDHLKKWAVLSSAQRT